MDVFVHGFLSGSIQSIVGHPLDTIKTNLQAQRPLSFSLRNIYKGFVPSLLCGCFQNGFLFSFEEKSRILVNENRLVSGFISGFLTSVFVSPLEQWKCQRQTGIFIKTPWYRGLGMTMARDGLGFSSYFYVYDKLLPHCSIFWAGGGAGVASWILSYPFDVYKTNLQLQQPPTNKICMRGLGIVSTRAFLVNGSLFYLFEKLKSLIPS